MADRGLSSRGRDAFYMVDGLFRGVVSRVLGLDRARAVPVARIGEDRAQRLLQRLGGGSARAQVDAGARPGHARDDLRLLLAVAGRDYRDAPRQGLVDRPV